MLLRIARLLLLAFPFYLVPPTNAQSLQGSQFRLSYSSSGITSLKRVQDKYDTDYIARGRAIGDVLLRYRAPGAKDWRRISGAMPDSASGNQPDAASFVIGEVVPTLASLAKPSASVRSPAIQAVNADLLPENSRDDEIPRFFWYGRNGTPEWLQYDFPEPKEVHSVQ